MKFLRDSLLAMKFPKEQKDFYKRSRKSKKTKDLPDDIPLIQGEENLYDVFDITRSGYNYVNYMNKIEGLEGAPKTATVWKKGNIYRIFLERPAGKYIFAGNMHKKETN